MKNEEILQKAIEKAKKNGFKGTFDGAIYCEMASEESEGDCIFTTIFNHGFAKAFFGEEEARTSGCEALDFYPKWKIELMKMALEKEPIKYLEQYI